MKKALFLVAYNPYFSRKLGEYWKAKKIKPMVLGPNHLLVRATPANVNYASIQPYIIRAQEMHAAKDVKGIQSYIQSHAQPNEKYALRAWVIDHPSMSGRDLEVKLGIALEKKGVKMDPARAEKIWYILHEPKTKLVSATPLSLDEHLFPYTDAKITEANSITRSGKKLRFLLARTRMNVHEKRGVDLGCGSGGWTNTLLEKGAAHITAIDRTPLDKKLQKNKKVDYIPERAEKAPKINQKIDFIVQDINVGPAHTKKIFLDFDQKNPGATDALITLKIMGGKDLNTIPRPGQKWGKWTIHDLANTWWARRECYVHLHRKKPPK